MLLVSSVQGRRVQARAKLSRGQEANRGIGSWKAVPQRSVSLMAARRIIRGVVFDMDGTLTVPVIDFALMRKQVGVTTGDILDAINRWPEPEQRRAYETIAEMEEKALVELVVMPGAVELCYQLDQGGIPRGLITRNVKRSVDYFHAHHFPLPPFQPAISRECGFAYKPSPQALLHICGIWGISAEECIMVGDSAKDDVVSGNRAGAVTIFLDETGKVPESKLVGELKPHYRVSSLTEMASLLSQEFVLSPPSAAMSS